jgi:hypothetical protein
MKAVLVATIGTRDLMFQTSSGDWYNIGDDRLQNGQIIGEQIEVIADLGLPDEQYLGYYRKLTEYLLTHIEHYRDRLKPVILGKLLNEQASQIDKVYLVGTDQAIGIRERDKDTLYACELIKIWIEHYHHISVEAIHLGTDGTNPSSFEEMFRWWRQVWRDNIQVQSQQPIWMGLKGGVGQASEAARVSGLSVYGDRIQFYDFRQNVVANRAGIPSDYQGPLFGTNYLWDRTQQQALRLLKRYDYAGVYELLEPYLQQSKSGFGAAPNLIRAGIAWNQGEFKTFFQLAKATLPGLESRRDQEWWWMAYEQAYLGVIRLTQKNTSEAMLHSFRAVEGCIWKWIDQFFPSHVSRRSKCYPQLLDSICTRYPNLKKAFRDRDGRQLSSVNLLAHVQQSLLEAAIPATVHSSDFKAFWSQDTRDQRNELSHQLGGLSERQLFQSWGSDIHKEADWQTRILNCLNLVSRQSFKSLEQVSLFSKVHPKVVEIIASYHPKVL